MKDHRVRMTVDFIVVVKADDVVDALEKAQGMSFDEIDKHCEEMEVISVEEG